MPSIASMNDRERLEWILRDFNSPAERMEKLCEFLDVEFDDEGDIVAICGLQLATVISILEKEVAGSFELALSILEAFQETSLYEDYQREDGWFDSDYGRMLQDLRKGGQSVQSFTYIAPDQETVVERLTTLVKHSINCKYTYQGNRHQITVPNETAAKRMVQGLPVRPEDFNAEEEDKDLLDELYNLETLIEGQLRQIEELIAHVPPGLDWGHVGDLREVVRLLALVEGQLARRVPVEVNDEE